jgi:cobalt-zinc-cadmium efflux system membrane fusion protein
VWVQADVYEKDIALIQKNLSVKVSVDAYPKDTFTGRITYVSDLLDPKTRTAKVRCEVANPGGKLKLDMFATIAIPTPRGRNAVMVPSTAIQQIDDQPNVFVRLAPTKFERRRVTLGVKDGEWIEVPSGVKARESIVTNGSFALKSALLREQIGGEE